MGVPSYPDEERSVHHGRSRASPTAKFFRHTFQFMLFFMCLAVVGGIIMGVIALHSSAAHGSEKEDNQARRLLARSYYGNFTGSGMVNPTGSAPVSMISVTVPMNTPGNVIPTGTAPVSMINATIAASPSGNVIPTGNAIPTGNVIPTGNAPVSMTNATVAVNTARGPAPSTVSPSVTLTVDGIGAVGISEATAEADVPAVNATITLTSTTTTVTNTRTITPTEVVKAASLASSSVSETTGDCVPATVTLTVTESIGGVSALMASSSPNATPLTTLVISDLYSQGAKGAQLTSSAHAHGVDTEIKAATETVPASNDLTTTVTVTERPTVLITSTTIADAKMPSAKAITTSSVGENESPCAPEDIPAAATPAMATVMLTKVVTETYTTTVDGSAALTTGVRTVYKTEILGVEETVFATGTVGILNNSMTALKTITVQPADLPTPEVTQTASSNETSPVVVSEGAPPNHNKRAGTIVSGCVVMVVATILYML